MGSSLLFIATDFPLVLIPSEYASSEIVVVGTTISLSIIVTVTACILLGIVLNHKRWLKVYVVMYLLLRVRFTAAVTVLILVLSTKRERQGKC